MTGKLFFSRSYSTCLSSPDAAEPPHAPAAAAAEVIKSSAAESDGDDDYGFVKHPSTANGGANARSTSTRPMSNVEEVDTWSDFDGGALVKSERSRVTERVRKDIQGCANDFFKLMCE